MKSKIAILCSGILLLCAASSPAIEIDFDIVVKGEKVGEVTIFTYNPDEFPGEEGVKGSFGVTKEDGSGNTLSIKELETQLGQDHLNWFQKVIAITPPLPGVTVPFIDPPKGGMPGVWADNRPWYFDETSPPPGTPYNQNRQLSAQGDPDGSILNFFDTPHGQPPGTTISFATFLISDYGNETYSVMGGFSWSSTIHANGHATITALQESAPFEQEYEDEIKNEFGYERVPDSGSTLTLLALGCVLILRSGRGHRQHRGGSPATGHSACDACGAFCWW